MNIKTIKKSKKLYYAISFAVILFLFITYYIHNSHH